MIMVNVKRGKDLYSIKRYHSNYYWRVLDGSAGRYEYTTKRVILRRLKMTEKQFADLFGLRIRRV